MCSGALVSKTHVVTAAHCFESCPEGKVGNNIVEDFKGYRVVVGKSHLTDARDNIMIAEMEQVYVSKTLKMFDILCTGFFYI